MTERMSKDAHLVESMTGRMSKLALTENQHQNPHRGGTGAILPDQNQVSTDPTWKTGQAGNTKKMLTIDGMVEAHAEGVIGKYRCQGEEQALPSQASPAHTPLPQSKDQLAESQSLYIFLIIFLAFISFTDARMTVSW